MPWPSCVLSSRHWGAPSMRRDSVCAKGLTGDLRIGTVDADWFGGLEDPNTRVWGQTPI